MTIPIEFQTFVETKGIRIFGHAEVALSREDALHAIHLLHGSSVGLLGGDVYFMKGSGVELAYANWHTDPTDNEDPMAFVVRSHVEALNYIKKFPLSDREPLFTLTLV